MRLEYLSVCRHVCVVSHDNAPCEEPAESQSMPSSDQSESGTGRGERMMKGGKGRDKSEWHHLYQTSSPQSHHSRAVYYHLVLYIIDLSMFCLFSVYLIVITDIHVDSFDC